MINSWVDYVIAAAIFIVAAVFVELVVCCIYWMFGIEMWKCADEDCEGDKDDSEIL